MNALFVYGLLKPGFRLHHVAAPYVKHSAPAKVRGRLYDAGRGEAGAAQGLPAARFGEDGDIEGVVLWLDVGRVDEALRVLDELEDEGVEYRRVVVDAVTDDERVPAYAYEYVLPVDGRRRVGASWPGVV